MSKKKPNTGIDNKTSLRDSYVDWFTSDMKQLLVTAYNRAKSVSDNNPKKSLVIMHGYAPLGEWFSRNIINPRGYSIKGMIEVMRPHDFDVGELYGNKPTKVEMGYSGSKRLIAVIEFMIEQTTRFKYTRQSEILSESLRTFQGKMAALIDKIIQDDKDEEAEDEFEDEPKEDPNKQAHALINSIINDLPADKRHEVRSYLQKTEFTLKNLLAIIAKLKINIQNQG